MFLSLPGFRCGATLTVLAVLAASSSTLAATPVYVDGSGGCNGALPCFTTVQAAVDNAGPAPAEVYACIQLKPPPDDAACLGKARGVCQKAVAKLTAPGGVEDKLSAGLGKACGVLPVGDLFGPAGLGFGAHAGECADRGGAAHDYRRRRRVRDVTARVPHGAAARVRGAEAPGAAGDRAGDAALTRRSVLGTSPCAADFRSAGGRT